MDDNELDKMINTLIKSNPYNRKYEIFKYRFQNIKNSRKELEYKVQNEYNRLDEGVKKLLDQNHTFID